MREFKRQIERMQERERERGRKRESIQRKKESKGGSARECVYLPGH